MDRKKRKGRRRRFLNYCTPSYPPNFITLLTFSLLLSSTYMTSYHATEAAAQTPTKNFSMYDNSTSGIKIQYPSDWHIISSNDSLVRFITPAENDSDTYLEGLSISKPVTLCGNTSLTDAMNRIAVNHVKSGAELNETKPIVLKNGNSAYKLIYTFINPQFGMLKGQDILTINDNKLYAIQYTAQSLEYYNYLPIVQEMIDSLQILNSSDTMKKVLNDSDNQTEELLTYTDNNYGISMKYPSDWTKEEIDTTPRNYDIDVVQFHSPYSCDPGKYNAEFSITIRIYRDESTPKNVDEELEYVIDKGNIWSTNFNVIESGTNTTLAGYPAYKIVWNETIDETDLKVMEMGTIVRGDVYVVEYRAEPGRYPIFLAIVQHMINSLKIK
jgi:hypothetical protein